MHVDIENSCEQILIYPKILRVDKICAILLYNLYYFIVFINSDVSLENILVVRRFS
jgi:hypothetical protein